VEFKNVSGAPVELPTLADDNGRPLRVPDGEAFTATGEDAKNLQASDLFERTDKPSGKSNSEKE
jgi:hypothetical protein